MARSTREKEDRHFYGFSIKESIIEVLVIEFYLNFYFIGVKELARNPIIVWDAVRLVAMRIHNASSRIELLLRFDVQRMAVISFVLTLIAS